MTVIGTGPTAGVAQTALNAQQSARTKDREKNRRAAEARELRENLDTHVQAIDEGDDDGNPSQLHIDGQLPDHQTAQQLEQAKQKPVEHIDIIEGDDTSTPESDDDHNPGDLYHHVDVQA